MEKAVAVVITDGKNLEAATKLLGIPHQTLAQYVKTKERKPRDYLSVTKSTPVDKFS